MRNLTYLAIIAASAAVITWTLPARAGYPMISGLRNCVLSPGQSSGTIVFHVTDDKTGPDNLTLGYSSDNPALVPADDDHIILGGSGKDRTVLVRPEPGRTGQATITITVTDTDGETNQDGFEVEVVQAPKI